MSEEIKEITRQLKEILNKYPNRQLEILLYVFGRDNLMDMINEPTYEELQQENHRLKERVAYLERSNNRREETIIDLREEQQLDLYKSVTDEVRGKLNEHGKGEFDLWNKINGALEILDKVKENKNES